MRRAQSKAMRRHPLKKLLATALGLIVMGCLWFYFAPIPLGGSTSYVVTHGVSMEPRFHTGDLAIVRSKPSYHIGEIVAYHNKMLHTVVLHRIIGREGGRYVFKGDNNNFIDPERPRASQLIGALWIHIAGGGKRLQSLKSPLRAGVLVALGMLLLTGGVFARRRRLRLRDRRAGVATPRTPRSLPPGASEPAFAILAIGVVVLLPFVVLALLAFSRAPSTRHSIQIPYTQSGTLSYSADTSPNPAYPDGVAKTGEPLFTKLVNDVNLRFDYAFATKARHSLTGKGSFLLLVTANDGWHRTLPLGSPVYFKGAHATITGTLSLSSLLELTRQIQAATRVEGSYEFAVVPSVVTSGSVEGVPLRASFSPAIQFLIESNEINLQGSGGSVNDESLLLAGTGKQGAKGALPAELTPSTSGATTGEQSTPLTLALGPWRVSVSAARTLALSAIGIILAALLAILALLQPLLALVRPLRDESASIQARYGRMIVPVAHVSRLPGDAVIDVSDMESLVKIAEHYDRSILREETSDGDAYWVTDESGQFRYTVDAHSGALPEQAAEPAWAQDAASTPSAWQPIEPDAEPLNQNPGAEPWPQDPVADLPTLEHQIVALAPESESALAPEPAPPLAPEPAPRFPPAPAPTFEPSTSELLVGEVYADELELGGIFAALPPQPEIAGLAASAAVEGDLGAGAWTVPDDTHTFVRDGVDRRRTDGDVDVSHWRKLHENVDVEPPPLAASDDYFTGLEWTTNS
jgi:signal peptidase I